MTELMGHFEVVVSASKPVMRLPVRGPDDPPPDPDDPPPEPVETELVYTRINCGAEYLDAFEDE